MVDGQESIVQAWRARARVDGPIAFRAIVRGTIEGAEGAKSEPANQCAAVLFGQIASGDMAGAGRLLGEVMETANHDAWFADFGKTSSDFMRPYGQDFVRALLDEATRFRKDGGNVGDYLDRGARADEAPWRAAMAAVWITSSGPSRAAPVLRGGTAFVIYPYCISLGIVSFKRASAIQIIPPGGSRVFAGLPYVAISLVLGWWGIPWGPIWTIQTVWKCLSGGVDVTDAVAAAS